MEALGAAAAISQFLVQFIAAVSLAKRIKGSSQSLKQYQEQLEGLRSLCEDISQNPVLGTEEVQRETQSILYTIGAHKDVSILLKKGPFYRAIIFILKERSFGDLFATLENKKTTLSLRVQSITSLAVHNIHLSITAMNQDTSKDKRLTPPPSPTRTEMSYEQTRHGPAGQTIQYTHPEAVYENNTADNHVDQHVGPYVTGIMVNSGCQYDNAGAVYSGNIKKGDGKQVLGLTSILPEGVKHIGHIPAARGHWLGNAHNGATQGSETNIQVHGTLLSTKGNFTVAQKPSQ